MAWSTPLTAVSGTGLTAAQWNASVRDNLLVTPAGLATAANRYFVTTGANAIVERVITSDKILTQQTTTNTSYVNLSTVGATVTITTGTLALAMFGCQMFSSGTGSCWTSYAISSATTQAATDEIAITCEAAATNSFRYGYSELQTLTGGSNVFTMKYRVGSLTGTFDDRHMIVMAF